MFGKNIRYSPRFIRYRLKLFLILEFCIAFVQAYIFIILQITYFSEIFN